MSGLAVGAVAVGVVIGAALVAGAGQTPAPASAPAASMTRVGPGVLRTLYEARPGDAAISVPAFDLDRVPVTNGEFLGFVTRHPEGRRWRRDRVSRLFADEGYLARWADPDTPGASAGADQPVTGVSWFAAKAYCAARDARLPTEAEWELAAAAGEVGPDGRAEPGFQERLLAWYGRPTPSILALVGQGRPNYWGIHDLHGLVWEWVADFNSTLVSSDSREGKSADRVPFCGAGGIAAGDKEDYASFLRFALRSSLEARYTGTSLGFRCARDAGAVAP